jgi:DNA polymerase-3 subunit delta
MTIRRTANLSKALSQGEVEPVYFLFGPESYLRDEAEKWIADQAFAGTLIRDFDDSSFSLTRESVRKAIASAETFPLMSKRRVVRIRNFENLKDSDEEELIRYIENPLATSVVIFTTPGIDKRKKLTKILLETAAFEFKPKNAIERASWARAHLQNLQIDIETDVLRRLVEQLGNDVARFPRELDKLAMASMPSRRITSDLVDQLIGRSLEHMNWDLTDGIISHNGRVALKILRDFVEDGVEPVMLAGIIAGTFRRLALAKELFDGGAEPREIFSEVRVPAFKQSEYLRMLKRTDASKLRHALQRIAETDLAIKTSKATPRMQIEMLVCELMI